MSSYWYKWVNMVLPDGQLQRTGEIFVVAAVSWHAACFIMDAEEQTWKHYCLDSEVCGGFSNKEFAYWNAKIPFKVTEPEPLYLPVP